MSPVIGRDDCTVYASNVAYILLKRLLVQEVCHVIYESNCTNEVKYWEKDIKW